MMEPIQQKDKLLFYLFDSAGPFLRLLSEAAERPDLISTRITIYRLAAFSKIARILCRAAEKMKGCPLCYQITLCAEECERSPRP